MQDYRDLYRTGPETPGGRYMRTFWHPIYVAEDLKTGWAKPVEIMSEKFTLYRGESGTSHLVAFRCAHRGMQLSAGWIEGDCIRCRFHGWKYDGSGQCLEVPTEDEAMAKTIKIRSYPVEEYLGLIFAYLGEANPPPPMPRYPDFENVDELWVESYTRTCNFVNNMENDPVHIPFAHRESELVYDAVADIPLTVQAEETDWGMEIRSTYEGGRIHTAQRGWPNITSFRSPHRQHRSHLTWRVPIHDENHWSFQIDVMHAAEPEKMERYRKRHAARRGTVGQSYMELGKAVLRGDIRIQDIEGDDKANIIWIQDYVTQVGQGTFADRNSEHLTRADMGVVLYRKIWEREVNALGQGKSTKQWARTERILANYED